MESIEQAYLRLAGSAALQCDALAEKLEEVIDGEDAEGLPCLDRLLGIRSEPDGTAVLVLQDPDTPRIRSLLRVDAILALAGMLRRERVLVPTQEG